MSEQSNRGFWDVVIGVVLENKLVVFLVTALLAFVGVMVAPFNWEADWLTRYPVPVDAIPNYGENQQIVFTEWGGYSPMDVEEQVTYPLTINLMGLPKVKSIRGQSMFGFSSIYIIFDEDADWDWSRAKVLEKLNSLPANTLPDGATPALGPDATAVSQVFWYTLEGRGPDGEPTGGWDPQELRSIQDWDVRYALQGVPGVAEVASVGGFVKEYQIDLDPDAMRAYGVRLRDVFEGVRESNAEVGARTVEFNKIEYAVRGLGFIKDVQDLRKVVVGVRENVPVTLDQIAQIELGPAVRRGALDKAGSEAVGGVVVTRHGANPLEVIERVKERIAVIEPGLPSKVLEDGTVSKVSVVPFYDRTGLIMETLGTLETAVRQQILVTIIVVLLLVLHLRGSLLISSMLPLAVLLTFIAMKGFGVDANIIALAGIAIAIGTIVDMGIVLTENVMEHLQRAGPEEKPMDVVRRATVEIAGAITTAVLTTVVSFLPVFALEAAEGKLFKPLAYTKTFALAGSLLLALVLLPPMAYLLIARRPLKGLAGRALWSALAVAGLALPFLWELFPLWLGLMAAGVACYNVLRDHLPQRLGRGLGVAFNIILAFAVTVALAGDWLPLGPEAEWRNALFLVLVVGGVIGLFALFIRFYPVMLRGVLALRWAFMTVVVALLLFGLSIWLGVGSVFGWLPERLKQTEAYNTAYHAMLGLGEEFMPSLDEGSFLYMPSTMPHASIGESLDALRIQDMAIRAIPEVDDVVGKIGRVDSALDPAPVSMVETIITYKPEYKVDEDGGRLTFAYDPDSGRFLRDQEGELIPDRAGRPFRQWRDEIKTPQDIWDEIARVAEVPGSTSAPKLQPIETRLIMVQTGMRAPLGLKVFGPDLASIEELSLDLERLLREVPAVDESTVQADRVVGKPYLEIDIDRDAIARYGLNITDVHDVIAVAIGGRELTTTFEGRGRFPVRVRYLRELREDIEAMERISVNAADGTPIPLSQLAQIKYRRGPQMIRSENSFLMGYVIFGNQPGISEVETVEQARDYVEAAIGRGELVLPAGTSYTFTGAYENQVRAEKRLRVIIPLALVVIFVLIYLQFKRASTTLFVFSGVFVAWSGGFVLLWLYGQDWFLDWNLFGTNMRELFRGGTINLSVAVWVGFLALFGIATDDGVLMGTYLKQTFARLRPTTKEQIRAATIEAASRRVRPAMMTSATTLLALLPVLTSQGRGADVMLPMAVPIFGGMAFALLTIFVVPTLYCWWEETRLLAARLLPDEGAPHELENTGNG